MTDRLSPERRARLMAGVRSKNTLPELAVRRMVRAMGFGYRLHRADLPGKPDLAFIGRRKAIFVHGCFWHRHAGCVYASLPGTRTEFWKAKFARNVGRDSRTLARLREMGWSVLVVWQCELKRPDEVSRKIYDFIATS